MKRHILLLGIILFSCAFQACKEGTNSIDSNHQSIPVNQGTENTFSMKMGSNLWTPEKVRIRLINDILSIQAQTPAQEAFTITIGAQMAGTYTFELGSPHSAAFLPAPGEKAYMTGITEESTGRIDITKLDVATKKLSATFQFNGYRPDGSFRAFTEGKVVDHDIE